MDNQATYTLKHMYTGQRDHHKNVVIQYDADGKSCAQCMGNKKKDVLELFIRGQIPNQTQFKLDQNLTHFKALQMWNGATKIPKHAFSH